MFQQRHMEALAETIQVCHPGDRDEARLLQWETTCTTLANMLARSNDRFNRDRFLRACQPGANVRARK